mgnify:FL=1
MEPDGIFSVHVRAARHACTGPEAIDLANTAIQPLLMPT